MIGSSCDVFHYHGGYIIIYARLLIIVNKWSSGSLMLIFGCGYLGERLAFRWREMGNPTHTVARRTQRLNELKAAGFSPILADVTRPETLCHLPPAETVVFGVARNRELGDSWHATYVSGLSAVLDAVSNTVRRFIYLSSSGVYGQKDGSWVDEQSPCHPATEGGKYCWEAEQCLAQHPVGKRSIVVRLAGIYGPGRVPRRQALSDRQTIKAARQGFVNLIHVDDAVEAIVAAANSENLPSIYNVSDGHPVKREDYFRELCRLYHLSEPTFAAPDPDSAAALRSASNKRLNNARLLNELGVTLRFPDYCEGLANIVATERGDVS